MVASQIDKLTPTRRLDMFELLFSLVLFSFAVMAILLVLVLVFMACVLLPLCLMALGVVYLMSKN